MKAYREAEKEEILETEMNHNFEADMYLEKLEHENEKVNQILTELWKKSVFNYSYLIVNSFINVEDREIGR